MSGSCHNLCLHRQFSQMCTGESGHTMAVTKSFSSSFARMHMAVVMWCMTLHAVACCISVHRPFSEGIVYFGMPMHARY